jgi:hypothetical protein
MRPDNNPSVLLRNYSISPAADGTIVSGINLEFFLRFVTPDLYAARLVSPNAADWYRSLRPWGFRINDIAKQHDDITILNNVINPDRDEKAWLHYILKRGGNVTIHVFDLAGTVVDVLFKGYKGVGEYSTAWNGRNRAGHAVARGIYFIKIVGPDIEDVRKVVVVK